MELFSFGKLAAGFAALFGFASGLLYFPVAVFLSSSGFGSMVLGVFQTLGFSLVAGFVYAGVGFFAGVVYGYFYNLLSEEVGGLEMVMDVEG